MRVKFYYSFPTAIWTIVIATKLSIHEICPKKRLNRTIIWTKISNVSPSTRIDRVANRSGRRSRRTSDRQRADQLAIRKRCTYNSSRRRRVGEGQRWEKSCEPISNWRSCEDRGTYRKIRSVRWESRADSNRRDVYLRERTPNFNRREGVVEEESNFPSSCSRIHDRNKSEQRARAGAVLSNWSNALRYRANEAARESRRKRGWQNGGKRRAKNGGDLLNQASLLAAESFLRGALTNGRLIPRECSARQASNDCQLTTPPPPPNNCRWYHYYLSLW